MRSLFATLIVVSFAYATSTPARAVPPTVTPSPGYDARLAEQRRAMQAAPPVIIKQKQWRPSARRPRHKH